MTPKKVPWNKHVAKFTQKQLDAFEATNREQYARGYRVGREAVADELNRMKIQRDVDKLAQVQAVTKLLEEAGRIMSRAGYMLGKLNGDNSR